MFDGSSVLRPLRLKAPNRRVSLTAPFTKHAFSVRLNDGVQATFASAPMRCLCACGGVEAGLDTLVSGVPRADYKQKGVQEMWQSVAGEGRSE